MERQRKLFLDLLRIFACAAVILLHIITGSAESLQTNSILYIMRELLTWCVPVFLMISGYLFLDPDREITYPQMLTKYVRRILLALFLFGVPFAMIELYIERGQFSFDMIFRAFALVCMGKTWDHMWYLYAILFLYLLTPALKWVIKKLPVSAMHALIVLGFAICSLWPFAMKYYELPGNTQVAEEGIYLVYYLCGYLFATGKERVETKVNAERKQSVEQAFILLLMVQMVAVRAIGLVPFEMAYNYPFTVAISVLIFDLFRKMYLDQEKLNTERIYKLSALSFAVYLVHPIFINGLYKGLHISLSDYPLGIILPLLFIGVSLVSLLLAFLLRKIPFLRKYVL